MPTHKSKNIPEVALIGNIFRVDCGTSELYE